VLSRTMGGGL